MKALRIQRKVDLRELTSSVKRLEVKARWAYVELIDHYWNYGEVPVGDRDLAAICGINIVALRNLKIQLGWMFDTDDSGRWRDYDLEAERALATAISIKRASAGLLGAIAKRARVRGFDLTPEAVEALANQMANASAKGSEMGIDEALDALANGVVPVASPGSIDRSISLESERDFDRSILRASEATAMANGLAKPPAEAPGAGLTAAANGVANAKSETVSAPELGPASPEVSAIADEIGHAMAKDGPSTHELVELLRKVCKGNVDSGQLNAVGIEPIRKLIAEGYDLSTEIVPALAGVGGMSTKLNSFRAGFILKNCEKIRASVKERGSEKPKPPPEVFVAEETPQYLAWKDYRKATGQKMVRLTHGSKNGSFVPSPWPPGYESSSQAAE